MLYEKDLEEVVKTVTPYANGIAVWSAELNPVTRAYIDNFLRNLPELQRKDFYEKISISPSPENRSRST